MICKDVYRISDTPKGPLQHRPYQAPEAVTEALGSAKSLNFCGAWRFRPWKYQMNGIELFQANSMSQEGEETLGLQGSSDATGVSTEDYIYGFLSHRGTPSHHPFILGFWIVNHSWVQPWLWNPPYLWSRLARWTNISWSGSGYDQYDHVTRRPKKIHRQPTVLGTDNFPTMLQLGYADYVLDDLGSHHTAICEGAKLLIRWNEESELKLNSGFFCTNYG